MMRGAKVQVPKNTVLATFTAAIRAGQLGRTPPPPPPPKDDLRF